MIDAYEKGYRAGVQEAQDVERACIERLKEAFCDANCVWTNHHPDCDKAQQEPDDLTAAYMSGLYDGKKQRTWVDLTDEEIKEVKAQVSQIPPIDFTSTTYARAFEVKLKEKNI